MAAARAVWRLIMKRRLKRMGNLFKESKHLILEHKFYFLAPMMITVIFLSLLFYKIGPSIIISFIYAGV